MEYTIIERVPDAFQQQVSLDHIRAMCQRAFGQHVSILSVKELGGGEYNNVYLIALEGMQPVVLRVSPEPSPQDPRVKPNEVGLMRREHYMQPFLAPIATLLPKTLMIDFTHQLINRDYMFQTYMEGELWSAIEGELTWEEDLALYRQLGSITKIIHSIEGETFGHPFTDHTYSKWSNYVIDGLEKTIQKIEAAQLDATDMRALLDLVQAHTDLLDEVTRPRLLHGDLWTFNTLVKRGTNEATLPKITAVLDGDCCWWGDPLADWGMFVLHVKATESTDPKVVAGTQAFWETYGAPEHSTGVQFRENVYWSMSFGSARPFLYRNGNHERMRQTYDRVKEVLGAIRAIV